MIISGCLDVGNANCFFRQSDFDFVDLELIVGSYSFSSSYYIQARAIYFAEGNTVSDKIKDRARLLAVNIRTDRNASVDYTVVWNQII